MNSKGTVLPGFIKGDRSLLGLLCEIFFVGMCGPLTEVKRMLQTNYDSGCRNTWGMTVYVCGDQVGGQEGEK